MAATRVSKRWAADVIAALLIHKGGGVVTKTSHDVLILPERNPLLSSWRGWLDQTVRQCCWECKASERFGCRRRASGGADPQRDCVITYRVATTRKPARGPSTEFLARSVQLNSMETMLGMQRNLGMHN